MTRMTGFGSGSYTEYIGAEAYQPTSLFDSRAHILRGYHFDIFSRGNVGYGCRVEERHLYHCLARSSVFFGSLISRYRCLSLLFFSEVNHFLSSHRCYYSSPPLPRCHLASYPRPQHRRPLPFPFSSLFPQSSSFSAFSVSFSPP